MLKSANREDLNVLAPDRPVGCRLDDDAPSLRFATRPLLSLPCCNPRGEYSKNAGRTEKTAYRS